MTIIGIITAISLPQFRAYRARAFDLRAQSDLRSVAIAEEAYFLDNESYLSCQNDSCQKLPGIVKLSEGVELNVQSNEDSFRGESRHPKGSGRNYVWLSDEGGLQESS